MAPDTQTPGPWREALAAYVAREARPVEKYGHQPRLYALTRAIAAAHPEADDDILYAAAWLHDMGVFTGHRPEQPDLLAQWDNVAYAIGIAPGILAQAGFPAGKVEAVLEAIRHHQPSAEPQTLESTILRDADILEQLGAVGVLRTVAKVGRDTRFNTFTDAIASLTRAVETLPPQLRLPVSRTLAQQRIETHRAFLQATASEAQSLLL